MTAAVLACFAQGDLRTAREHGANFGWGTYAIATVGGVLFSTLGRARCPMRGSGRPSSAAGGPAVLRIGWRQPQEPYARKCCTMSQRAPVWPRNVPANRPLTCPDTWCNMAEI
jgi:hypothetical protein